ncbi:chromosome segregation protein SMC, partial [Streptomyces sp. SID1034]|nr:chromosome segregation protein SMC [Streptomyces sp. SID1034]
AARHDALALGLRRKDGTGALLGARDALTGLLGPAAELLTVAPGYEVPLAAALGVAADAIAVSGPSAAAEAIRLLRKQDAGRAALLLSGAPEDERPAPGEGPPRAADLVRGPAELMPAVRQLLRGVVVVATLEDAEDLVYARPALTAVTADGDVLGAHFAHGGSAGAPSLLEVQAAVDEAAAELADLAVRCEELAGAQRAAEERRGRLAAEVEELGERRRAAEKARSSVAQQLGRLAGQARGAADEAERTAAAA